MKVKVKTDRVIRSGSWDYLPRYLRSNFRDRLSLSYRYNDLGFRLIKLGKGKKYENSKT